MKFTSRCNTATRSRLARRAISFSLVATSALALSGCSLFSWMTPSGPDYQTRGQQTKVRSLEVPPDLTKPIGDDRFTVPDSRATTFSQYSRERSGQAQSTTQTPAASPAAVGVLPKFENVRMVKAGEQHWLVVKASPDKVWPALREFWTENGFVLARETQEAGIMETDWAERRTRVPQDGIRNAVGRILEGTFSPGERDRFRTRVDAGAEPGTTEVFISHRGIEEVFTHPDKAATGWQFRPTDKMLEAEMLGRIMVKLGAAPDRAVAVASATPAPAAASSTTFNKATGPVRVAEAFDRTWRRVGLALDRSGFTVEDRDRSKGTFFVRYVDPEVDVKSGEKKGWLDKLAFWRSSKPSDSPQFRIKVSEQGAATEIDVVTADGKPDTSPTARRILGLLFDQLK
ncbi:MAG: outer membrane protein assembly factor BamC [Burkholderiales bacterium]